MREGWCRAPRSGPASRRRRNTPAPGRAAFTPPHPPAAVVQAETWVTKETDDMGAKIIVAAWASDGGDRSASERAFQSSGRFS
jgi:hypothetical protein